jgi:DNA-directed RNA polymerase subunit K/omega
LSEEILIGPRKLTRFERARIIGARALQVSLGAPILAEIPDSMSDPVDIALAELEGKVLPMTLRRALPDKTSPGQDLSGHTSGGPDCRERQLISSPFYPVMIEVGLR